MSNIPVYKLLDMRNLTGLKFHLVSYTNIGNLKGHIFLYCGIVTGDESNIGSFCTDDDYFCNHGKFLCNFSPERIFTI